MNDYEELFDGAIAVNPYEKGETFSMSAACYTRMAQCALRCKEYGGIEPTTISRLRSGPGCQLTLYGQINQYTLRVSADTSPAKLSLYFIPLDSKLSAPGCELRIGYDEPSFWLHICDVLIFWEGECGSSELVEWQEVSDCLRESNDQWGWMA